MLRSSICIITALLFLFGCQNPPKTAFVNTFELFEGFKGKLELEAKHRKDGLKKQELLDSMKIQLIALKQSEKTDKEYVANFERQFLQLSNQFSSEVDSRNAKYTEEVWKQINQYTFEYGKEKGYDYIFGASSNGTLMYAKEANDVTNEVLEYINARYDGK